MKQGLVTLFLVAIFLGLPLKTGWSLVMSDEEILDWVRGEPLCIHPEKSRLYRSDFGINREGMEEGEEITGTECEGNLWQLLWSLAYLEELQNAVRNPSQWIRTLYRWVNRRIDSTVMVSGCSARVLGYNNTRNMSDGTQQMRLCNYLFTFDNPFYRMAILIHEARHSETAGNYYLHVICQDGPLQGLYGCDQRYSRSGGGAYSFTVYPYAWIYYNGRDEQVSPAMKDWAKNTANAIIDNQFVEQPEYRLR